MFDTGAAARLGGPAWLVARRKEALARFESAPRPSADDETWRYSRIAELDLDAYRPALDGGGDVPEQVPSIGERAATVVVRDGRVVDVSVDPALAAKGLAVGRLAELDPDGSALGAVAGSARDAFGELHDAFVADPVLVRVPAGMVVPAPVVVVNWTATDGVATFPRLVVQAGADSEVRVHDHQASADVAALVVPIVELDVGDAARVRYQNVQLLGRRVWQLGRQASRVGRDGSVVTAMVALGGDYARLAVDSTSAGKGGSADMLAVYFGDGDQLHDFRTLQDHVAPQTTSNLLFKGAVAGHARAVWTGLIHIGKQATGVNAFQTNRNIKLSDGAWAESVPNLEIENNDVRCSHASAVGPVDEDQRFYLESRGVRPEVADRLIVLGFFDEVLERLPVDGAAPPLRDAIAAKLEAVT